MGKVHYDGRPSQPMADRVAVVTGAAQGIGAAIAETLSEHGAFVVATDVQFDAAPSPDLIAGAVGGRIVRFALDVADEANWCSLTDVLAATVARVDVLVNNAALAEQVRCSTRPVAGRRT